MILSPHLIFKIFLNLNYIDSNKEGTELDKENFRQINAGLNTDSNKNCLIRNFFSLPTTFLIPTSFARSDAWAVERFMKLIHAIINIKTAMEIKIMT